jgi:2,5-diketo-D-gluconate reductase B
MDTVPAPGFGTSIDTAERDTLPDIGDWDETGVDVATAAVASALAVGYRHVDTAEMYETERAVGRALELADAAREDVFLATKVLPEHLAYEDVLDHARASLDRLGVDTVDLLYVHWPIRAYDPEGTLAAFDELYEAGEIRHVGLSNFTPEMLEEALSLLDAPVFAHQVECHPLLQQDRLRRYAREHDHSLVAYSPLAQGAVTDDPDLVDIAADYDATPAQVALAWLMSKESVVPIPCSTTADHIRENYRARDIELDANAIERIDSIDREHRTIDFPEAPWN